MVIIDVWHSRDDFQKMLDDPEFRKKLLEQYSRPASCGRYCCGWGGGNTGGPVGGDAPGLVCTTREPTTR